MKRAGELFSRYFPLTLIGTPSGAGLVLVLGKAFAGGNPYAYIFSLSGLALLLVLAAAGKIQALRIEDEQLSWHTRHRVFAGKGAAPHTVELLGIGLLPFFRLRFSVSGPVKQGETTLSFHSTSIRYRPENRTEHPLSLAVPHCGMYHAGLTCSVEDIFGLTRARCGSIQTRGIPVQPGVLHKPAVYRVAERGAEEKDKMKESDVERYYMREYVPGDRFRDINWKSSSRGGKLYTRISPLAQEETVTITLCIRFYAADTGGSPEMLALTEYQKSRIMSFILSVTEAHPDFRFEVFLNSRGFVLENEMDIEKFALEMGQTWVEKTTSLLPELPPEGLVYLFTLPSDSGISRLRQSYGKTEFLLHSVHIAGRQEVKEGSTEIYPLFPFYGGEDFPSLRVAAGFLRKNRTLQKRTSGSREETGIRVLPGGGKQL